MRLFITGGTGFLGRAVVEACLEEGHSVTVMVRDGRGRVPDRAQTAEVRFDEPGRLREALAGTDAVVHLAGKVSRDPNDAAEMHGIHVEANTVLLDAVEAVGIRKFILASTSGTVAIQEHPGRLATEHDTPAFEIIGRWPYYTSKLLQEQEVLRRNAKDTIEAVVLNPSLLLGPGDERLSSTGDVLNILNRRLPALTDGTVAFVDVRDAAPAFVRALERGRRGQRYLLNGANMSLRNFVERVAGAGNVSPPKLILPRNWATRSARWMDGVFSSLDLAAPVDPVSVEMGGFHWGCDARRAQEELGFRARDPQATIDATVRWLEDRHLFRRR